MKNKKLYAILTLVAFMITLMPIMAFAAPTPTTALTLSYEAAGVKITANGDAVDIYTIDGSGVALTLVATNVTNTVVAPVDSQAYGAIATGTDVVIGTDTLAITATAAVDAVDKVAAAALAANNASVSRDASVVATVKANLEVDADAADQGSIAISLKKADNTPVTGAVTKDVYVWAEVDGRPDQASDAFTIPAGATALGGGIYKVSMTTGTAELDVNFLRAGNYVLKGSFEDVTDKAIKDVVKMKIDADYNKIVVTGANQVTSNYAMKVNGETSYVTNAKDSSVTVSVEAVGVAGVTVDVQIFGAEKNGNRNPLSNMKVNLETNSANIELSKATVTTNYDGKISFDVSGVREGDYKIYVQVGDFEGVIPVRVGATSASNIEVLRAPKAPIAADTATNELSDVFRFTLTDINGNIVVGENPQGAIQATSASTKYVVLTQAPAANKVKDSDLSLSVVSGRDYYTIATNSKQFAAEGSYELKIALDNGRSVTVPFEVKKFGKAVELTIEYPVNTVELGGMTVAPEIFFTDDNGVTKTANASRVTVAANGYAVSDIDTSSNATLGQVTVKNDEKYLGTTITVTAVAERENLVANTTLTVAEEATGITFNETKGLLVNDYNKIDFRLTDSQGNNVALGTNTIIDSVNVIVTDKSDKDAKVSANITSGFDSSLKNRGTGVLAITSNKAGTATVQVVIKATSNNIGNQTGLSTKYYTGVAEFSFGDAKDQTLVDKAVKMVLGEKVFVVDGKMVVGEVAPFAQDNRTYIPVRSFEALGFDVEWNESEPNLVTLTADDTVVVMEIGSNIITINGEATTMDVPALVKDYRTFLPIRFAAEAIGYEFDNAASLNGDIIMTKVK